MANHNRELHPAARAALVTVTLVFVCAGGALLVSGCFTRSVPMAALGVACIFAAVITRPT